MPLAFCIARLKLPGKAALTAAFAFGAARAVVFLDPYALQVNWSTLELLAKTLGMLVKKSEVTHKRDYADLSNLELVQLLAKEARELELLEHTGQVINAEALD